MKQKLYVLPDGDVINLPMIVSMKAFKGVDSPSLGPLPPSLQINTVVGDFLITCSSFQDVCDCRDDILAAVNEMSNSWDE